MLFIYFISGYKNGTANFRRKYSTFQKFQSYVGIGDQKIKREILQNNVYFIFPSIKYWGLYD